MIHPLARLLPAAEHIGDGMFATGPIPRGTIVWTQDCLDQVFSPEAFDALPPALHEAVDRYAHLDAERNRILCWDEGRYINHDCNPSLRGVGPWFQVARRDLVAGDQLTCDYAECNVHPALHCSCDTSLCRGKIHASDLVELGPGWDAEARDLAAVAATLDQPLWPYLLDPEQARAWLDGTTPLPSFTSLCAFESKP
jgi:uncharacterized protein